MKLKFIAITITCFVLTIGMCVYVFNDPAPTQNENEPVYTSVEDVNEVFDSNAGNLVDTEGLRRIDVNDSNDEGLRLVDVNDSNRPSKNGGAITAKTSRFQDVSVPARDTKEIAVQSPKVYEPNFSSLNSDDEFSRLYQCACGGDRNAQYVLGLCYEVG
ncbi:MAG: hypothetical protein Q7T18_00510, partial [Sedimentisphaerales bacterium]|nr:hypothetical protein [Sedimentisphaerales bacterium]